MSQSLELFLRNGNLELVQSEPAIDRPIVSHPGVVVISRARSEDIVGIIYVMITCSVGEGSQIMEWLMGWSKYLIISKVFVARIKGKIVGTMAYSKSAWLPNGKLVDAPEYRRNKIGYIWGLAVLLEYRRRGIGERLVRKAERDMYLNHFKGWYGNAASEGVAQWYVGKFGARIKRLEPKQLVAPGVYVEKKFYQEGAIEELKKGIRKPVSFLLEETYAQVRTKLTASARDRWIKRSSLARRRQRST